MTRCVFVFVCFMIQLGLALPIWAQTWPNQPADSTVLTDFPFNTTFGSGWDARYRTGCVIESDDTSPVSRPSVMKYMWVHNRGYGDVCVSGYRFAPGTRDMYIGLWWKPSNPFTGWTIPNQKIMILDQGRNHCYLSMQRQGDYPSQNYSFWFYACGGGADNRHIAGGPSGDLFFANVSTPTVGLGQWHRIEWYAKTSTTPTSRDGILRMWYDGQMVINYTTVNNAYPDWSIIEIHPVWDSFETACPTCIDYHWFDHAHIAVGGTQARQADNPPGPPATPTIRNVTVQ